MKALYETRIAAGVAGQSSKAIRQEFDRVLQFSVRSGGRLRLGFRDVVYFQLKKALELEGISVDPKERKQLYWVLSGKQDVVGRWQRSGMRLRRGGVVPISFDLGPIVKSSSKQLRAYQRGSAEVVREPAIGGGVPVFKGTRIPVDQVVEQIRNGVSLDEIREDYPGLSEWAVKYAALQARMEKEPGRPRKPLRIRRVADEAAD